MKKLQFPKVLFVCMITLFLASCASSMGTHHRAGSDRNPGGKKNPRSACYYKG